MNEYLVLIHNKFGTKNAIYKAKNEEELIEKTKKCGDTLIAVLHEKTL